MVKMALDKPSTAAPRKPDARIFGRNLAYLANDLKKVTPAKLANVLETGERVVGRVFKGDLQAIKDLHPFSAFNVARVVGIDPETLLTVDLREHPEIVEIQIESHPETPAAVRRVKEFEEPFAGLRHFKSTEAQNKFGMIMDVVEDGEPVVISRHDERTAVMVPADEYRRLKEASGGKVNLLTAEFDAMFASMQRPDFVASMDRAFGATPKQLGAAAVKAARQGHG